MARYKHIDTSPRFLAVDLQRQLLPGTFEHAMNHLIDNELDLSGFDIRFKNDITGAAAYPPAMLLKIVLFAYSMGIVSSRNIERACREHVTFIALSGDSQPHFTTLAGFVSTLGDDIDAQRANESGCAVEALLPSTQHREVGASRVCAVISGKEPPLHPPLHVTSRKVYSHSLQKKSQPEFDVGTGPFQAGEIALENRLEKGFSTASTSAIRCGRRLSDSKCCGYDELVFST